MRRFLRISDTYVVVKLTLGLTGIVSGANGVERRNRCRFNVATEETIAIGPWLELPVPRLGFPDAVSLFEV